MILEGISLSDFRSYSSQTYVFSPQTTVILGPNTAGKSNLLEAIYLLSTGKSYRADKDTQMIQFEKELARVKGKIKDKEHESYLEVVVSQMQSTTRSYSKKFLVNGVPKRRVDFAGILPALLFVPSDLEIISSSPSHRRKFLDDVLETTDREYRIAMTAYEKALRQRNALLDVVQETGYRNDQQFLYWDNLLIEHGSYITKKREELIAYFNTKDQNLISCTVLYDNSVMSRERLDQYRGAETASGVTLVGPHRDEFSVELQKDQDVRHFGSRGQQRLVVLQLKLLQLSFMEDNLGERPLLLLDDIFSELDQNHIEDVLHIFGKQQTIVTTTHEEFIKQPLTQEAVVIKLSDF